jgi:hypothetical protein
VAKAVADERESCAKQCDDMRHGTTSGWRDCARALADLIRARGRAK